MFNKRRIYPWPIRFQGVYSMNWNQDLSSLDFKRLFDFRGRKFGMPFFINLHCGVEVFRDGVLLSDLCSAGGIDQDFVSIVIYSELGCCRKKISFYWPCGDDSVASTSASSPGRLSNAVGAGIGTVQVCTMLLQAAIVKIGVKVFKVGTRRKFWTPSLIAHLYKTHWWNPKISSAMQSR